MLSWKEGSLLGYTFSHGQESFKVKKDWSGKMKQERGNSRLERDIADLIEELYLERKQTNIMPELNKRCLARVKMERFKTHIVNYLCSRSVNGKENDSKRFTKKLFDSAKDLYKKDLTAHFGCVNAIEFSADGNLLFSGGDDRRVLMWNVNDAMMYYTGKLGDGAKPCEMKRCHYSNIFCLAIDDENRRVLSGSNDDQVIVHDYFTGNLVDVFLHDSPVFSLSLHPGNGNIFASAADNGKILIYDIRESNADLLCVAKLRTPFHGVMFNPCEPSLIATANSKLGVHLWDLRKPKEILLKCSDDASMAVRWNHSGTILLALRNLLPIVIYDPLFHDRKLEFDAGTYFNACTMKSCSFAGDNDEYILSGSDDFNLYMWKIPEIWPESKWVGSEHLTLTGHRSIVNQVRYSSTKQLIATSGVEKIVKLWSPFPMPYSEGSHDKPTDSHHRVLCSSRSCCRSPGFLTHDYSQGSVEEDTRMIHFFDNLLRNELDDLTLFPLSQPYHLDPNTFSFPSKKKETRIYEKLIRKKKKRLSRLLLENRDESKSVCALSKRNKVTPPPATRQPELRQSDASTDESCVSDCVGAMLARVEGASPSREPSAMEGTASDTRTSQASCSPSLSPPSFASNATCAHSCCDSHLSSEQLSSDVGSSSERSKVSLKLAFSDSNDSNGSTDSKSLRNELGNLKDSGINLSESSDSEEVRPCAVFRRKRFGSSRCYRSSMKRKRKSVSSDSSDSEPLTKASVEENVPKNCANRVTVTQGPCSSEAEKADEVVASDSENEDSANEETNDNADCLENSFF